MKLIYISTALRMFRRARYVRKHGIKTYSGSPESIAKQIIDSCWDKKNKYFRVSDGHFNEFYCRDFGMCAESLVKLGYKKQVHQTLDYALRKFSKHGRITTSIAKSGECFDFPYYGADSLPFLIRAIKVSGAKHLIKKHKAFLDAEIRHYQRNVFDSKLNLVRIDKHFSSMKDYAKRSSSCYSNCMLFMLADDLGALKMKNMFKKEKIRAALLANFWNGKYFYDDTTLTKVITGDANTYPFWCGVTNSKLAFDKCMKSMEKAEITKPFPLKYTTEPKKINRMHLLEFVAGDYERDAIWIHLGLCFLDVVKRFDKKRFNIYMKQYESLITKHNNFLEVYDRDGNPFRNFFYCSDESMSWVSKWLALKKS